MRRITAIFVVVAVAAAAAAWYAQGASLYVNGSLASSSVIVHNGTAYAPIRDLANALHLNVQKTSRGYELSDSGGATQIEGVNGKVNDVLWNGYARFQVLEVVRGQEYTSRFNGASEKITPYPAGDDLVVVICRLKNGTKETQTAMLPGGDAVALTDDAGRSYAPVNGLSLDVPSRGAKLLPGGAVDFALTFNVPKDAVVKDLVYEPVFFARPKASEKKFRVSVAQS